ncbi:MAG: serine kinase [Spirochaetes bacterium RBG_13_51_14]|nr:MAG: serine kinase [Spirochaetes bacterium RBG_13_51_14]
MKLRELIELYNLELKSTAESLDADVTRAYAGDILSDVMAHATEGSLWITLQTHANIVPVALLKSLAGIVLVNGGQPENDTLAKANNEKVPILTTRLTAFEIIGRLYKLGIRA